MKEPANLENQLVYQQTENNVIRLCKSAGLLLVVLHLSAPERHNFQEQRSAHEFSSYTLDSS